MKIKLLNPAHRKRAKRYAQCQETPCEHWQSDKIRQKCQRFAKLKEVFCQRTCRPKNTTFNFAQPHPSPPTTQTNLLKTFTDFFDGGSKYSFYICQYLSSQNKAHWKQSEQYLENWERLKDFCLEKLELNFRLTRQFWAKLSKTSVCRQRSK